MLTVGELKEALEDFPDSMEIIISPDDEGNNLHKANGIGPRYVETLRQYYVDAIAEEDAEEYGGELTLEIW